MGREVGCHEEGHRHDAKCSGSSLQLIGSCWEAFSGKLLG